MRSDDAGQQLPSALHHLYRHGSIVLQGAKSRAQRKWERRRRNGVFICLGIGALGVIALVAGLLLSRIHEAWALLIVFGPFLMFIGFVAAGIATLVFKLHRYRAAAEQQPVVLNPHGIWLRGIGPIGWHEVQPPMYRMIFSKNDVMGRLPVMPLTEVGQARLNQNPSSSTLLVGPVPYLHLQVPYMLLPGIDGFSEADTMELFQVAYGLFALTPQQTPPHPSGGTR